jgi:protein-L-isoaspartate(D-aspartate) O-methyltransferase
MSDPDQGLLARNEMVDRLRRSGVVTSASVEWALRHVPRHVFLPREQMSLAYADEAIVLKVDGNGSAISSASQPTIVATMLELLVVASGHRVLEIGTGSGYNAALLAAIVGDTGAVVTVEIEPDLKERALGALAKVRARNVHVLHGDGSAGAAAEAPFDRVAVTTGARSVSEPWVTQLVDGGRLVVPIVDSAGIGSIIAFDRIRGELVEVRRVPCGFLLMRSPSN